jgi:uncharacterized membrane protein YdjX (TVP38/TMEM64 family)
VRQEQEKADDTTSSSMSLQPSSSPEDSSISSEKQAFLTTAVLLFIGSLLLRVGGRSALLSFLGLDLVTGSGLAHQIDDVLDFFRNDNLGVLSSGLYLGAWVIAKVFCVDALTIALAFSSGVLYGGLWQGCAVSVFCSTFASSILFYIARGFKREKVRRIIERKPLFAAVDRACNKEGNGFKTVLALRLSPVLPIPVAAYSYLYGASAINPVEFLAGTAIGSIKPYALDSYLGLVAKDLIDGTQSAISSDTFLIAFVGAIAVVGSFATQVASTTWEEIKESSQQESDAEEEEGGKDEGMEEDFIDLLPLPTAFISLVKNVYGVGEREFGAAWVRLEEVVRDELEAVEVEVANNENQQLPGYFTKEKKYGLDLFDYPGVREIKAHETEPSTVKDYTLDSCLFSLVLAKQFFSQP